MDNAHNYPKSSISELVKDNYVFAAVLHHFGISFFLYGEKTLEEVCVKFKVSASQLMQQLEDWATKKEPSSEELYLHPIEVLVEYLRKKHYSFVGQQLPFLSNMILGIRAEGNYREMLEDMRLMFPLFVDDFVHHIHEEEDTLFKRITLLHHLESGDFGIVDALRLLEAKSMDQFAHAHEIHDDEMEGIRKLTHDYRLDPSAPMELKVLFYHLQNFEKELCIHAKIENDLLFPKAIELEKEVKRKIYLKIQSN
jgi:regulator of cell morphogenesis and NO signaling